MKKLSIFANLNNYMVCVAQLVRVVDCGSIGRGFESHRVPLEKLISKKRFRIYMKSLFNLILILVF